MHNNWGNTIALINKLEDYKNIQKRTDPLIKNIEYKTSNDIYKPGVKAKITFDPSTVVPNEVFFLSFVFKKNNKKTLIFSQKFSTNHISTDYDLIVKITDQCLIGSIKVITSNTALYSRKKYEYKDIDIMPTPVMYKIQLANRSKSNNINEYFKNIDTDTFLNASKVYFKLEYNKKEIKAFYSPKPFSNCYNSQDHSTKFNNFKYILRNIIQDGSSDYYEIKSDSSTPPLYTGYFHKKIKMYLNFKYPKPESLYINTSMDLYMDSESYDGFKINGIHNIAGMSFIDEKYECYFPAQSNSHYEGTSIPTYGSSTNVFFISNNHLDDIRQIHTGQGLATVESPNKCGWYIDHDYNIYITNNQQESLVDLDYRALQLKIEFKYKPYWAFESYKYRYFYANVLTTTHPKGTKVTPRQLVGTGSSPDTGRSDLDIYVDLPQSQDDSEESILNYNNNSYSFVCNSSLSNMSSLINFQIISTKLSVASIYW